MKTILNYILPIKHNSTWIDSSGKFVRVEYTTWFNDCNLYPTVTFYYLTKDNNYNLMILDRYSFSKYMTKI
jgi:hypothetical protein